MIRIVLLATALLAWLPAHADENSEAAQAAAKQAKLEARRHELQAQLDDRNDRKSKLEKERDAALMNANVYVLPKYKLEAADKAKEIEAVDAEIDLLQKQLKDLDD